MASHLSGACTRRGVPLTSNSHLTPLVSSALISKPCCGASQTSSRYRAYATVNKKRPRPLHDVWGEIPELPRELFTKLFDATRRIEKTEKGLRWLRFKDEQYLDAIDMFRKAAPIYGSDWVLKLKKDLQPKPELLNDIGCVLARHTPQPGSLEERLPVTAVIQWGMFSGAAHLGCDISTLSMAKWLAFASPHTKDIAKRPLFRPIIDLHRKYLDEGRPMALYVEGEFLLRTGKTEAALRILNRAFNESNSTVVWWADVCNALAIAHNINREPKTALEFFGKAVREGHVEALKGVYLGTDDAELRDNSMYKLACRGYSEVLHEIALLETAKAREEEFATPQKKVFQEKWAAEWRKMAAYDIQSRNALGQGLHAASADDEVEITEEGMRELQRRLAEEDPKTEASKQ